MQVTVSIPQQSAIARASSKWGPQPIDLEAVLQHFTPEERAHVSVSDKGELRATRSEPNYDGGSPRQVPVCSPTTSTSDVVAAVRESLATLPAALAAFQAKIDKALAERAWARGGEWHSPLSEYADHDVYRQLLAPARTITELGGPDRLQELEALVEEHKRAWREERVSWLSARISPEGEVSEEAYDSMPYASRSISRSDISPHLRELGANDLADRVERRRAEIRAENERAAAERAAAAQAEKDAYTAERRAWIEERGSRRLRVLLAEGLGLNRTYRDERLAAERPGWSWMDKTCGEEKATRDADEATLEALLEGRKSAPDAKLGWLADGDHVQGCEHEDDGELFATGYALFADFMGERIVKVL